ncbi:endonuclease domain-containing protein [Arthrobacter sp. SAFR-014]|uniref:endonuclease domain-containing protein n=1 Tax=Arthrobacter sp. SAFR-014 TaxID=3387280 RepID=UPI003F7BBB0E
MDPSRIIKGAGGVLLTRDVVARGGTEAGIRLAVRSGAVWRVERVLLAVPGADPELVAAGRSHGLLTCVSAAPRYKLWQLRPATQPHYWHSNGRAGDGCVNHRLALTQRRRHGTIAALPDVLLQALLCLPPLESLVMVECAYNRGDIDLAFLRRYLTGNRCGKARDVLARVERGADSLLETLARVLFREAGIATETQVWIDGIGSVDFLLEGFLIVEIDGIAFHLESRQFKKDRRRDNAAAVRGLPVLRFFYDDVVHSPEAMLAQVREVLARGSSRWPQPNQPSFGPYRRLLGP